MLQLIILAYPCYIHVVYHTCNLNPQFAIIMLMNNFKTKVFFAFIRVKNEIHFSTQQEMVISIHTKKHRWLCWLSNRLPYERS